MSRRLVSTYLALVGLFCAAALIATPAHAIDVATIRVTIERITALSCLETSFGGSSDPENPGGSCSSEADFYAIIFIGGSSINYRLRPESLSLANKNDISPNWTFSSQEDWSKLNVPVRIQVWDRDGAVQGDDDPVDLTWGAGRELSFGVDLAPCFVSGSGFSVASMVRGGCGTSLYSQGSSTDRASIQYRIAVEPARVAPPAPTTARVRCTHSPVWPQPGQQVTFTAESLTSAMAPVAVEKLEIWTGILGPSATRLNASSLTFTTTVSSQFVYLCRIVDGGVSVLSSARTGWVGNAPASGAVPILKTGSTQRSIDITFIADRDDYTSALDPNFLADVGRTIKNAYFGDDFFLRNDRNGGGYNFWIITTLGDADPPLPGTICPQVSFPATMFADSQMLIHLNSLRDCAFAYPYGYTGEPYDPAVVRHESGHRPFGLADEYCCDGGNGEADIFPNVFADRSPDINDCEADAIAVGRPASACRTWTHINDMNDWFTHEGTNSLMNNNAAPQLLTQRRMSWIEQSCRFREICAGR